MPGETKRISTGCEDWDKNLFCAIYEKAASFYGSQIEVIAVKPEAKILVEGTREFNKVIGRPKKMQKILEWCTNGIIKARQHGYDIVEFERQVDIGTVVLNEAVVIRNYKIYEYKKPPQETHRDSDE